MPERASPVLSVIVPVHNAAAQLDDVLGALRLSSLPAERWELFVVDDASSDGTMEIARRHADRLIRIDAPARGPAHARNVGAAAAKGDILVFIDGDVRVKPDTLSRFVAAFEAAPSVDAVFGAYDTEPAAPGTVSQYRNLLHHYVHSTRAGDADTFWAGCGAVRRAPFHGVGGFDARQYSRPQIEDIHLGYRLRARGGRIVLDPRIQATHLKRWTLRSMIVSDVLHRGVPWTRLLLRREAVGPGTLNIQARERILTALAAAGTAAAVLAIPLASPALGAAAGLAFTVVIAADARLIRWFARLRGVGFALRVVPLRLLYYVLNAVAVAVGLAQHLAAPRLRATPVPPTAADDAAPVRASATRTTS